MELPKTYQARDYEEKIYRQWLDSGFFNPDICIAKGIADKNAPRFTISLPPPNVTGQLHLGHAAMLAYEDLLIRYHRLRGDRTLWVPGTDHAAIATQTKVEKIIAQAGTDRHKLGREEFIERVKQYVEESKDTIHNQVRHMGSSLDWSRERYTLDPEMSWIVQLVFKKMYDDGLIYRGQRIVNWCPRCHSTLADDEVSYREEKTLFYYFRYGPVIIGTARPETKFADKVIIVHPDDKRYQDLIGKKFKVPWIEGEVEAQVIADPVAEPELGSGAMTITPAHSFVDFELAQKYNLDIIKIIDENGHLTTAAGKFAGRQANEARPEIVKAMTEKGLVDHIDNDYIHNLSICYRCETPIEPLVSEQWFINVDKKFKFNSSKLSGIKPGQMVSLKELSLQVIKTGQIKILPERFEKIYLNWVENLHDWCISRQIWWGHRIPVWYREDKLYVGVEPPQGPGWQQDEDTLDTWFSSALWTFSTLLNKEYKKYDNLNNWLKDSPDFKNYHPVSVMETGYDIIFFWVARMILMTTYNLGDIPFPTVYLHGMVRDKQGRKMSKSLDNGIDPIDMIEKYGADALRLAMIIGSGPGNDLKLYEEKIAGFRNFVNKIWNISRYILSSTKNKSLISKEPTAKTLADKWILAEFNHLINQVTTDIEQFRFSPAGEKLYDFTWNKLADWYLEIAKIEKAKDKILNYILQNLLILWHPFIPFATEVIWQNISPNSLLMIQPWPTCKKNNETKFIKQFAKLQRIITRLRNMKVQAKIPAGKIISAELVVAKDKKLIKENLSIIEKLSHCQINLVNKPGVFENLKTVESGLEIYLPVSKEVKQQLQEKKAKLEKYISSLEKKLSNQNFIKKAPREIVGVEKQKLKEAKERLGRY